MTFSDCLFRIKIMMIAFNNISLTSVSYFNRGAAVVVIVWYLDLQLHMQSVPITTKVVIKFEPRSWRGVLDTTLCDKVCQRHVGGFLRILWFPPPII